MCVYIICQYATCLYLKLPAWPGNDFFLCFFDGLAGLFFSSISYSGVTSNEGGFYQYPIETPVPTRQVSILVHWLDCLRDNYFV